MPVEDDMGIFLDVLLVRLLWLWCRYDELFSLGCRWITLYVGFLVSVYASRQGGMYVEFESGDLIGLFFN